LEETINSADSGSLDADETARPRRRAVPRSNFFVASLWAPVPPIVLGAAACLWVLLVPETLNLGETARNVAGAILIGLPVVYTGIFGASYFAARALNGLRILGRLSLVCVCAGVAIFNGVFLWLTGLYTYAGIGVSAAIVGLTFVALTMAALLWWWVAVTVKPVPEPLYVKRPRSRRSRSQRRDAASGAAPRDTVQPEQVANELIVRWEPNARRLVIMHPDRTRFPRPLAEIGAATLDGMPQQDASRFLGDYLTELIPELRSRHAKPPEPGSEH